MYLSRIYSPSPGLGQASKNTDRSFPRFALVCPPPFSPQVHVCYELATVPLEPRGPNTDCIARSLPPPSRIHTHTHTHTHSLSPSLSGSGITTTHTAPRPAQRAFSFRGRRSVYFILSHFRTRARTPTPQYNDMLETCTLMPCEQLELYQGRFPYSMKCRW